RYCNIPPRGFQAPLATPNHPGTAGVLRKRRAAPRRSGKPDSRSGRTRSMATQMRDHGARPGSEPPDQPAPGEPVRTTEPAGLLLAFAAAFFWATSAPLMRLAEPMSPFEKSLGRLVVGAACVGGLALASGAGIHLRRLNVGRFALYG